MADGNAAILSGQVSIYFDERTRLGNWSVRDGVMTVDVDDETAEASIAGLERYPDTLARLLTVQVLKGRQDALA